MTRTVPCPECHRPANLLDSFTLQRRTGPVRYLRVQCEGPLSFLVSMEEMSSVNAQLPTDRVDSEMDSIGETANS